MAYADKCKATEDGWLVVFLRRLASAVILHIAFAFSPAFAVDAQSSGSAEYCVVNVASDDVLNIRAEPNADAPILGGVGPGECGVLVNDTCERYWCPAEAQGKSGWVNRRYIAAVSLPRYCISGIAAYDKLEIRAEPSLESKVLVELPSYQCNIVLLPFAQETWQKIRLEQWEGWANGKYLSGQ